MTITCDVHGLIYNLLFVGFVGVREPTFLLRPSSKALYLEILSPSFTSTRKKCTLLNSLLNHLMEEEEKLQADGKFLFCSYLYLTYFSILITHFTIESTCLKNKQGVKKEPLFYKPLGLRNKKKISVEKANYSCCSKKYIQLSANIL